MKNKKMSVCLFPETVPGDETLFPLVHAFGELVYCRAVEGDEIADGLRSSLQMALEEEGLCRSHVPAPLGEERERFLALIKDLKERGGDYADHLKNLSLSGLGRGGGPNRESKSSIVEGLLKTSGVRQEAMEGRQMLLWQARLLLKLAEIFDEEQRTLAAEFERISTLEEGLFSELRREQGQPFSLTRKLSSGSSRGGDLFRLRLKAWARLFCLGAEPLPEVDALVTTSRDALDLLLDEAENQGVRPSAFLDLELPARAGDLFQAERRDRLVADQCHVRLQSLLRTASGQGEGAGRDGSELALEWSELLERIYPAQEYGRCCLRLYALAKIVPCKLLLRTFARASDSEGIDLLPSGGGVVLGCLE